MYDIDIKYENFSIINTLANKASKDIEKKELAAKGAIEGMPDEIGAR